MTDLQRGLSHREHGDRRPHRAEMAALSLPVGGRPAAADDRACSACACPATAAISSTTRPTRAKKADEAVELLDEIFERPDAKAVVFSQWLGMHELLRRRLKGRKWEHVLFHGGVPGPKRKDLVDRFREDPHCRAFLSTDAGGVGLNLQHASVVLNMDLPWNPAVLEQRIGRVHRLGQRQPVRVVNFVAQGTIEEGMLSVLRFKKSLFAGVLGRRRDGGVPGRQPAEQVHGDGRIGDNGDPRSDGGGRGRGAGASGEPGASAPGGEADGEESKPAPAATADPWTGLLQAGMALLQQFAGASGNGPAAGSVIAGAARRAHRRNVSQGAGGETGGAGSGAAGGSDVAAEYAEVRDVPRLGEPPGSSHWYLHKFAGRRGCRFRPGGAAVHSQG